MLPRLDHGLAVVAGMRAYHAAVHFLDRGRDKLPNCLSGLRMHLNTIPEEDNWTSLVKGRQQEWVVERAIVLRYAVPSR